LRARETAYHQESTGAFVHTRTNPIEQCYQQHQLCSYDWKQACQPQIGFLSFGHWTPSPHSQTRSASDALLQSIELAVAAEELGSPFPLLAAVGAKTRRIEIGTAVIDMRYENPLYMAEDAGAADIIAGGRLQLGISR
jgi:luciferase-like monooxygenase